MSKKTVSGVWESSCAIEFTLHAAAEPRRYVVPLGFPLVDRDTGDEWSITLMLGDKVGLDCGADMSPTRHRAMTLASLAYAFDLEPHRKSGPPLRTQPKRWAKKGGVEAVIAPSPHPPQIATTAKGDRPQPSGAKHAAPAAEEESTPLVLADHVPRSAASSPEVALAAIDFDGDTLHVARLPGDGPGDGWVSLPSLLAPFGKRVDNATGLLAGWARTRSANLPSRKGGGHAVETTLLHYRDAPLLVARLDQRGMDEDTKATHSRYLRRCADVLAAFFSPVATSSALTEDRLLEVVRTVVRETTRGVAETVAPFARRLDAIEQHMREQTAPLPHALPLPAVQPGHTAALGGGRTLHVAHPDGISQRAAARRLGLPLTGTGKRAIGVLADLEGVWERPELHRLAAYVSGTGREGEHRLLTQAGVDACRRRAGVYVAQVHALGWYVTGGDGQLAPGERARLGMTEARVHAVALAAAKAPTGAGAAGGGQQSMGFDA